MGGLLKWLFKGAASTAVNTVTRDSIRDVGLSSLDTSNIVSGVKNMGKENAKLRRKLDELQDGELIKALVDVNKREGRYLEEIKRLELHVKMLTGVIASKDAREKDERKENENRNGN